MIQRYKKNNLREIISKYLLENNYDGFVNIKQGCECYSGALFCVCERFPKQFKNCRPAYYKKDHGLLFTKPKIRKE
jgi:hypothetical protein